MPIDVSRLPVPAQKILDPNGAAPLRAMAAKGIAPGLKPADMLAVVVLLATGEGDVASTAKQTLLSLPGPLVNGALAGDLHPFVLDAIAPVYVKDHVIAEKIINHAAVLPETIAAMASISNELVSELIATNEERLLKNPIIIEKLYTNDHTRMSTADRILELAVRNGLELGIPAFSQAAAAIKGELILEATEAPSFDDEQYKNAEELAKGVAVDDKEETHTLDKETGNEEICDKYKPIHAVWTELRGPAKIRMLSVASMKVRNEEGEIEDKRLDIKTLRMLGLRDKNPLVATAALETPGISDSEIERIAKARDVCEEVLREISNNREWTSNYLVKFYLTANPRTPFASAAKWIVHLRDNDLKTLAKSKDVSGAVQTAVKQQLQRKGKISK